MNEKNDSKDKETKTSRKRLSLTGATLDINKILASKAAVKGKVEIIGDAKPVLKPESATKTKSKSVEPTQDNANTHKLTNEEQARRDKAVKAALNQEKAPTKSVSQSTPKEINEGAKEHKLEDVIPIEPNEGRSKHGHIKEKYDDPSKETSDETFPTKKKNPTFLPKLKNVKVMW